MDDHKLKFQEDMKDLFELISSIAGGNGGSDEDMVPEGYGEFGLDITNPFPLIPLQAILSIWNGYEPRRG